MTAVAVGLAVGLAGAVALAHVIQNQLYEVGPLDPLSHVFALLLLATTALVAFFPPALRASRVEPVETLREP